MLSLTAGLPFQSDCMCCLPASLDSTATGIQRPPRVEVEQPQSSQDRVFRVVTGQLLATKLQLE